MNETILNLLTQLKNNYPKTATVLYIIGIIVVFRKILKLISSLYRVFLRPRHNLLKRYGQKSWALITGSSDGIGKAFAISLAKLGFNIILSARTVEKLQKVKDQIQQKYSNIQVKIVAADYKKSNDINYIHSILQPVINLNISLLVNNVGVDVLDYYHDISPQQIIDLIKINCFACTLLNRIFIPIFKERRNKNPNIRSAIVNVSSVAGQLPIPLHNVYSASKAYVDKLSRALSYEYPDIDIISLRPSEVSTPMTFHKKLDIMTIRPVDCVQGLLNDLGYDRQSNGYWNHKFQSWLYEIVPESIFNWVWLRYIGPGFIQERRKAMKNN